MIDNLVEKQQNWLISCKERFLIDAAFDKFPKLEWPQYNFQLKMKKGDIVYIYKTKPDAEITYKGIVTETQIKYSELKIDDSEFILQGSEKDYKESDLFFEFQFCPDLPRQKISLNILKEYGLKDFRSPFLSDMIANRIESLFTLEVLDNDDNKVQEIIQNIEPLTIEQAKESSNRKLQIIGNRNSEAVVKDARNSKYVLKAENYLCQIDNSHSTFLTNNNVQYMEGHHLIPCTITNAKYFNEKFNRNIDCIENIVCICPTCHKAVHLGNWDIKEKLLKIMLKQQEEKLMSIGINISEKELLELYK